MAYILLKPNAGNEVIADFVSAGGVSSAYDRGTPLSSLRDIDLISGAAQDYFGWPSLCIDISERSSTFPTLKHSEFVQTKYLKPLSASRSRKLRGFIMIWQLKSELDDALTALQKVDENLSDLYFDITGRQSELYVFAQLSTEDHDSYFTSYNDAIRKHVGKILGDV